LILPLNQNPGCFARRTYNRGPSDPHQPSVQGNAVHQAPSFDPHAFARALARLPRNPEPMPGVRALILPHHWLAGDLIAAGLRDLAASGRVGRVVLLAPDHPHAGRTPVTTSDRAWRTAFGDLAADTSAVDRLVRTGLVARDPALIEREHGIAGLVPAVAHFLPGARLIPLAVRNDLRPAEIRALADQLARLAEDERTVILLSADFSHDLTAEEARRMDGESLGALRDIDADRVIRFGPEHLDARGATAAVMLALRRLGATTFVLRANSDASAMPGYGGGPVTSYVLGYYRERRTVIPARPAHP
jgi:AmmeMemoRadiSam system protein B